MRICCGTDLHKPHDENCPKQLEWRREQNKRDHAYRDWEKIGRAHV